MQDNMKNTVNLKSERETSYPVWRSFYYNGIETNIDVSSCGKIRRVPMDWYGLSNTALCKYGEVDLYKLKKSNKGYLQIGVKIKGFKNKTIQVHQIVASAFLHYKFQGHKMVIDHIDSDILNNNITNLRIVTQRENTSKEKTIKSGLPVGVSFNKKINKYVVSIKINNIQKYLGSYNTVKEASEAYTEALKLI